jgi:hypothetical protein
MSDSKCQEWNGFRNGPYLVLSDASTFDGADGCFIAYVTDEGQEELEACSDFNAVEDDQFAGVTLNDLIEAYNQVHGTDL